MVFNKGPRNDGLQVDLQQQRLTSTSRMDLEERKLFGKKLISVFLPTTGMIVFRGAPRLGQIVEVQQQADTG